ncbi:interleukin-1 receptor-associated kinase 4 [Ambystoma mexicanum]|uniref:interleukin-1 receptor-associated kinase 4 n=1 Tax=Ambystoma mexicanum TaxID=8296 RepID=UPI0037E83213
MEKSITPTTYVRCLNFALLRELADFLDPQEGWRQIAMDIKKPSGEPRYTQLHLRRFEGCFQMGKSPTCELLHDWGTTNCTVSDLVDLLDRNKFVAAARLLLPDQNSSLNEAGDQIVEASPPPTQPSSMVLMVQQSEDQEESGTDVQMFSFNKLLKITGNFNDKPVSAGGHKLGEGGFGVVYKGYDRDKIVAVKKLTTMVDVSIQELKVQFDQEIQTLTMCRHENLVELIGFSSDGDHHCLVYMFMSNGSLLDRLACLDGTPPLSWSVRYSIAQGTANGIHYLHENHHVHRDIKSANILLNDAFVPKVSDFGLTRAFEKCSRTVMTERIVGTTAYMAPEALRGEITIKSDIFSLGVVFLEIITGLPPVDENRDPQLLLDIKEEIEDEEKTVSDYLDEKMEDCDSSTGEKMYSIASQCLHQLKNRRPDIKKVIQDLEKLADSLQPS